MAPDRHHHCGRVPCCHGYTTAGAHPSSVVAPSCSQLLCWPRWVTCQVHCRGPSRRRSKSRCGSYRASPSSSQFWWSCARSSATITGASPPRIDSVTRAPALTRAAPVSRWNHPKIQHYEVRCLTLPMVYGLTALISMIFPNTMPTNILIRQAYSAFLVYKCVRAQRGRAPARFVLLTTRCAAAGWSCSSPTSRPTTPWNAAARSRAASWQSSRSLRRSHRAAAAAACSRGPGSCTTTWSCRSAFSCTACRSSPVSAGLRPHCSCRCHCRH